MNEHNLQSVAFPILDESQRRTLFAVGDLNMNFIIVKAGEVEIVDYSGDEPKTVTIHRQGEFTGDISHLTGLPAIVSGVARGDCEMYEVTGDALRNALNQCPAALIPLDIYSISCLNTKSGFDCKAPFQRCAVRRVRPDWQSDRKPPAP